MIIMAPGKPYSYSATLEYTDQPCSSHYCHAVCRPDQVDKLINTIPYFCRIKTHGLEETKKIVVVHWQSSSQLKDRHAIYRSQQFL